jgi:RHS repeat-associated protein
MRSSANILVLPVLIVLLLSAASGQDYLAQIGRPTFSSMEPVELGFVNTANGNLHLEIPLGTYPQRGSRPLTFKLVYDSRIWSATTVWAWNQNPIIAQGWGGWRMVSSVDPGTISYSTSQIPCNGIGNPLGTLNYNFLWYASDGTPHLFPGSTYSNCPNPANATFAASDSSGYSLSVTNSVINDIASPDGTNVLLGGNDRNGNYFGGSINTTAGNSASGNIVDTLGRTPLVKTNNCGTNLICYDLLNSQGGTMRVKVTTQSIPVHTAFSQQSVTEFSGNITVIQNIQLPDGSSYQFGYDSGTTSGHYGELKSLTLPTSATVNFGYSVFLDALGKKNHWVTSYTAGGGTWTYSPGSADTSLKTQRVTVTKPSGDTKTYSFTLNNGAWRNWVSYSSGKVISQSWNSSPCTTAPNAPACTGNTNFQLQTETTSLPGPAGTLNQTVQLVYPDNSNSLPTQVSEWNYYIGSLPTNPTRITKFTYYGYNEPASVIVTDGSQNKLAETDYGYDESGGLTAGPTGIMHHDDVNFGSSRTTRGNLTSVKQWISGTNFITSNTMVYDITGQPVQSKDANNHLTTFSYTNCFYDDNGANPPAVHTASAANAFVTSTTLPVSGSVTSCYYFGTGKTASTRDQNTATSYFHFGDLDDRPTTQYSPTGGWSLNNYTSSTQLDTYTGIQDATASTGCTSCRHDESIVDTLGRLTQQILVNDPDGQTIVKTDYDASGRVLDTSHPYRTTSDSTYGFETVTYDAQDRPTKVTHQDGTVAKTYYGNNVIGGGGLTQQQCITNGTSCSRGYPTLSVDEAGKIRQVWTDTFGKVVEVDEPAASASPGGSANATGTVTFSGGPDGFIDHCPGGCVEYNGGSILVTVGSMTKSIGWGAGSTGSSLATSCASLFNSDPASPVTASASGGGVVTFTAKVNYSLSVADGGHDPNFVNSDYSGTASGSSLTGGVPPQMSSPTFTYYVYDPLSRLQQATVISSSNNECNRTYAYDNLSRLTSVTEPEPGDNGAGTCPADSTHTTTYTYSVPGSICSGDVSKVCTRLDGRGITTAYSYVDGLNRLTGISYAGDPNNTPSVSYSYDQTIYNGLTITNGKGRRTGMSDGSGTTAWSFDPNGNVVAEKRTIAGITKTISYAYNKDNSLKQLTYPGGRVVNFTVGNAERTTAAIDNDGTQYAIAPSAAAMYAPTGGLASAVYGKGAVFTGLTETRTYNNRLQLTGITASSTAGTGLNLGFGYTSTTQNNYHPNNNGEILTVTNNVDTGRTENNSFDDLGRIISSLSQATSGADCWGQNFTFDEVANLKNISIAQCSSFSFSSAVNSYNQLTTGYTFDNAGNMTNDGSYTYTYSAENEILSGGGVTYTYDGNWMRVKKSSGTLYWRDIAGNTIEETNLSGTRLNQYVFFGGRRAVRRDSGGSYYYFQTDQIGSTRSITKVTSAGSASICYDADFTPFGSEMMHTTTCAPSYKFTGYERDPETGLDYAFNRYYNPRIGRFMSSDPLGSAASNYQNPQSWNRYAYVLNKPLTLVDPRGEDYCPQNGAMGCAYDIEGVHVTASYFYSLMQAGFIAQCPANKCETSIDGVLVYYMATDLGGTFAPFAGPGSIFGTNEQAMIAGSLYAESRSLMANGNENCGVTLPAGDQYTFSTPVSGTDTACTPTEAMTSDYEPVSGAYHSHGVPITGTNAEAFSVPTSDGPHDTGFSNFWSLPLSLATPGGRVMIYNPDAGCQVFFLGSPDGSGTVTPICPP